MMISPGSTRSTGCHKVPQGSSDQSWVEPENLVEPRGTRWNRVEPGSDRLGRLQNAFPTLSIDGPFDKGIGFGRVRGAHRLVIPLDLLAGPIGHVAEMVGLGRPPGVLEVRARDRTNSLRVIDPFDPVAWRPRQCFRRRLEVLELLLGQELAVAEQHALLADEQLRTAAPFRDPAWRLAVALMPDEL